MGFNPLSLPESNATSYPKPYRAENQRRSSWRLGARWIELWTFTPLVIDKAELPEFVHEEAHARPGRGLADNRNDQR